MKVSFSHLIEVDILYCLTSQITQYMISEMIFIFMVQKTVFLTNHKQNKYTQVTTKKPKRQLLKLKLLACANLTKQKPGSGRLLLHLAGK